MGREPGGTKRSRAMEDRKEGGCKQRDKKRKDSEKQSHSSQHHSRELRVGFIEERTLMCAGAAR